MPSSKLGYLGTAYGVELWWYGIAFWTYVRSVIVSGQFALTAGLQNV